MTEKIKLNFEFTSQEDADYVNAMVAKVRAEFGLDSDAAAMAKMAEWYVAKHTKSLNALATLSPGCNQLH